MAKSNQQKSFLQRVKPVLPPPPWAGPPLPYFMKIRWPWYKGD